MNIIYKIARNELKTLFYSPVAWLLLVAFAFMTGARFCDGLESTAAAKEAGRTLHRLTAVIFERGVFATVQHYLYLFVPFLTMGLLSREIHHGSIKLLYSSPVSTLQIVLGKFLAMMIFGLALVGTALVPVAAGAIKEVDLPAILAALLGVYLLFCAYAAVGLFLSSLTSYLVVAVLGTFTLLGFLDHVGGLWQSVEIVRDVTYWLSMKGRAATIVGGLVCSEDVLYFLLVVALFLAFTVIHLDGKRRESSRGGQATRYLLALLAVAVPGYVTTLPATWLHVDATAGDARSIAPASREALRALPGRLTITGYGNALDQRWHVFAPVNRNREKAYFKPYLLVNPRVTFKRVFFHADTPAAAGLYPDIPDGEEKMKKVARLAGLDSLLFLPPSSVAGIPELRDEEFRSTRVLSLDNGARSTLRFYDERGGGDPRETEIIAAVKRLVSGPARLAFVAGHDERDATRTGDRHYGLLAGSKTTRAALVNQGFDVTTVTLDEEVPADVDILAVIDPRREFSPDEIERFHRYVARGGNLLVAGEPGRGDILQPLLEPLGARLMPGQVVNASTAFDPGLVLAVATPAAGEVARYFLSTRFYGECLVMPGCAGLETIPGGPFRVVPLLSADPAGSWNRLLPFSSLDDLQPLDGEMTGAIPVALALSRAVGDKEQRVILLGDADCFAGAGLTTAREGVNAVNRSISTACFRWLTRGEYPIDLSRPFPPDNDLRVDRGDIRVVIRPLVQWLFPSLLALAGLFLWIRRRGR